MTKTVLIVSGFALASGAYPSTISSFSISSFAQDGTPCSMSGSGPGSAFCSSFGSDSSNGGGASITLTDNSLQLTVSGHHAGGGSAVASIIHDDLYSVSVDGQVSALVSVTFGLAVLVGVGTRRILRRSASRTLAKGSNVKKLTRS